VQAVFQQLGRSIYPRMSVAETIAEPLHHLLHLPESEIRRRVSELLALVGLGEPHRWRRPRELSGGQRHRVAIVRAIAISRAQVIRDEPTSSLDVSVQGTRGEIDVLQAGAAFERRRPWNAHYPPPVV
jgi:ABC-type dipeptide/oligopeptide/nickel transport system ATPase subunit